MVLRGMSMARGGGICVSCGEGGNSQENNVRFVQGSHKRLLGDGAWRLLEMHRGSWMLYGGKTTKFSHLAQLKVQRWDFHSMEIPFLGGPTQIKESRKRLGIDRSVRGKLRQRGSSFRQARCACGRSIVQSVWWSKALRGGRALFWASSTARNSV
jgi:hypothetical protein